MRTLKILVQIRFPDGSRYAAGAISDETVRLHVQREAANLVELFVMGGRALVTAVIDEALADGAAAAPSKDIWALACIPNPSGNTKPAP